MKHYEEIVAGRILEQIRSWPAGLPVFGQLTPSPATPLYERLKKAGRLNLTETPAGLCALSNGPHAIEDVQLESARLGIFLKSGTKP